MFPIVNYHPSLALFNPLTLVNPVRLGATRAHLGWLCSNRSPHGHRYCGWRRETCQACSPRSCSSETLKTIGYPSKPWHMRIWPLFALWRLVLSWSLSPVRPAPVHGWFFSYVFRPGFNLFMGSHMGWVQETSNVIRTRVHKYKPLCQQSSIPAAITSLQAVLQFGRTALNARTRRQDSIPVETIRLNSRTFILITFDGTCTLWVPSHPCNVTWRND